MCHLQNGPKVMVVCNIVEAFLGNMIFFLFIYLFIYLYFREGGIWALFIWLSRSYIFSSFATISAMQENYP